MRTIRVAIFASGAGTNAEALIKKIKQLPGGKIEFVLSDRKQAPVLEKASLYDVPSYLIEKTADRGLHEKEILKLIDQHRIDWILLAGYMNLISADFLRALGQRHQGQSQVVNVHPSLLPAYKGAKAMDRAYADQVSESGVTIHLVDEGMDTGPVLMQQKIPIEKGISFDAFKAQIHELEHKMYTELLEQIVVGKIPTHFFEEVI